VSAAPDGHATCSYIETTLLEKTISGKFGPPTALGPCALHTLRTLLLRHCDLAIFSTLQTYSEQVNWLNRYMLADIYFSLCHYSLHSQKPKNRTGSVLSSKTYCTLFSPYMDGIIIIIIIKSIKHYNRTTRH